jgi:gamma-glutamylcyclotransferase (GGCT)/AIG2-like uncharacterized protein YtfP
MDAAPITCEPNAGDRKANLPKDPITVMETSHLFVYGTLMSAATSKMGRAQRGRLQRESEALGPATTAGRLYDLGRYPGLVAGDDAADVVHGEAFALRDPVKSLRWLDAYEGIVRGDHASNEYQRLTRPVRLADGTELTAWIYVCARDPSHCQPLPGGRWSAG